MLEANFVNKDDPNFDFIGNGKYELMKNDGVMYWRRCGKIDNNLPTIDLRDKTLTLSSRRVESYPELFKQEQRIDHSDLIEQSYSNNVSLADFLESNVLFGEIL